VAEDRVSASLFGISKIFIRKELYGLKMCVSAKKRRKSSALIYFLAFFIMKREEAKIKPK